MDKNCLSENLSVYKKMASLIPFQTLNGLTVGYVMHCLEDLIFPPENSSKDTFLTISLMLVGAGGAIGAYSAGYLSDRLSSKKVFYVGVGVCLASFILGMIVLNSENEVLSLFASVLSGFGMMYTNSMLVVMCSKYYEGSMMVFGTNRQIINLAFLVYSLTINVISP
jgi:predicted MFS family arabinose efflux permease